MIGSLAILQNCFIQPNNRVAAYERYVSLVNSINNRISFKMNAFLHKF